MLSQGLRDGSWVLNSVLRFMFAKEINKELEKVEEGVIRLTNVCSAQETTWITERSHRIIGWFGLQGTLKTLQFQLSMDKKEILSLSFSALP